METQTRRVLVVAMVIAITLVASIPLLMLLGLAGDGTGWGACTEGLSGCQPSVLRAAKVAAFLLAGIFSIYGTVRLLLLLTRPR